MFFFFWQIEVLKSTIENLPYPQYAIFNFIHFYITVFHLLFWSNTLLLSFIISKQYFQFTAMFRVYLEYFLENGYEHAHDKFSEFVSLKDIIVYIWFTFDFNWNLTHQEKLHISTH